MAPLGTNGSNGEVPAPSKFGYAAPKKSAPKRAIAPRADAAPA